MKCVGIREGKARLSELARAAADGETTVLTVYGKPIAVISPIEQTTKAESGSNADELRKALLSLPIIWILGSRAPTTQPTERHALNTWLIDTPLFATLALSSQKPELRHWLACIVSPFFSRRPHSSRSRRPSNEFRLASSCASAPYEIGSMASPLHSVIEFTLSTPQSRFERVRSFLIAIPRSPVIAFMTWCSWRRLRPMVMAC